MHLAYLSCILRHKWFVLVAGLKLGVPLWRLIIHDWSKFTPAEWGPYARFFYAKPVKALEKERKDDFMKAWIRHIHRNPHHWNHWVVPGRYSKTIPMPEHFVREMVADWSAAGRAINGRWDVKGWYEGNANQIVLSEPTRKQVEILIREAR